MTSIQHSSTGSTALHQSALTLGFLSLTTALAAAYSQPATGYELSVYQYTPQLFWIGIAVAAIVGIGVVAVLPSHGLVSKTALGLTVSAALSVVALPLLRGYRFYGAGDSLTHLGWAREMQRGILNPLDFIYPAIHLIANYMAALGGIDLTRAIVAIPTLIFPLVSVVFFGLCLSVLSDSRWAFPIGILVGILFIPINSVSIHALAHPSSQAVLFFPVALYLLFRHMTSETQGFTLATPFGLLFGIVTVGMVFLHPQESLGFLVILYGILFTQWIVGGLRRRHPMADTRSVAGPTGLMTLTFLIWTVRHERARGRVTSIIDSLLGGTSGTLSEATTRGASLDTLGGSLEELFLKLFAVTLVFCLLAAIIFLFGTRNRFKGRTPRDPIVAFLAIGLTPLAAAFVVVFLADQGDHYFRFLGTIMVPVTVMGAIGLTAVVHGIDLRVSRPAIATILVAVFGVMLALQLMTVHAGPYTYRAGQHVTDHELEGYGTAFDIHDGETPMLGVRSGPRRYVDAHFGQRTATAERPIPGYTASIPEESFNTDVSAQYESDRYVAIKRADYEQEVRLYQGFRYSEAGFQQFDRDTQIHRVQDNGEFRLYRLDAA